ncbi:hypothetical protein MtrunA17_Chr8g0366831 [Medicago truncatula]|uniref:Uncharacterized protein n=1 Tax=Medicago truncatula TaxID=3880 RepID=A0A396GK53_MEDTR|nr:hypothetical protein MtrunA17_Chr8g0366831 [Medicago truncatula]
MSKLEGTVTNSNGGCDTLMRNMSNPLCFQPASWISLHYFWSSFSCK